MIFYSIRANATKTPTRAYTEESFDLLIAGRVEEAFAIPSILVDENGEPDLSDAATREAASQPGFRVAGAAYMSPRAAQPRDNAESGMAATTREIWRRHEARYADKPKKRVRVTPVEVHVQRSHGAPFHRVGRRG